MPFRSPFPFKWWSQALPYLGVKLTSDISTLYQANYVSLYTSIEQEIKYWRAYDLSWMGRWQSLHFILLQVSTNSSTIHILKGSCNHWFTNSNGIMVDAEWLLPCYVPPSGRVAWESHVFCTIIEPLSWSSCIKFSKKHIDLTGFIWRHKLILHFPWTSWCGHGKEHRAIMSAFLSHALRLWDTVCKLYPLKCSPVTPLFNNPYFLPGQDPEQFAWWFNKGLYRIAHFIDHKGNIQPSYFWETLAMPLLQHFACNKLPTVCKPCAAHSQHIYRPLTESS